MAAPEPGSVEYLWCSAASNAHLSNRNGLPIVEFTRAEGASFDGAAINIRHRWDEEAIRAGRGSPICVIPSSLPQLLSPHGPIIGGDFTAPTAASDETRIILHEPRPLSAGSVLDRDGALFMLALPVHPRVASAVWYADDSLVLAGDLLRTASESACLTLRNTLLDIHRFLGEELGQGDRVRALALVEAGADKYASEIGQFLTLDARFLATSSEGQSGAERLMVRNLTGIWWRYGVRPSGRDGPAMAVGLTQYTAMRWLAATGRRKELAGELDSARLTIAEIESAGRARSPLLRGMRIGLALWEASKVSSAVADELRRWCADDWGCAVPVSILRKRLASIGVWVEA